MDNKSQSTLPPYDVVPYSLVTLKNLFVEGSHEASSVDIERKSHLGYFEEYFKQLKAQTIIVEREYIDRDFLEDFSNYYVRCFDNYRRKCLRLHFLNTALKKEHFDNLLFGRLSKEKEEKELQKAYLGFIVVKPLPNTIIGRTCLCTYPETGTRVYSITREYPVNLFGFSLNVRTLAFQEQDSVVAACATSALWSVFHGTGKLFQHHIPTPVEITKAATERQPRATRQLPNREGLFSIEIAQAIRSVGLEPLLSQAIEPEALKTSIHAYLHDGIPLLMGFDLYECKSNNIKDAEQSEMAAQYTIVKKLGRHAVAVTGYNLGPGPAAGEINTNFLRQAMQIDKLYVHDDQVGPFARIVLDNGEIVPGETSKKTNIKSLWSMRVSYKCMQPEHVVRAVPNILFIPVYHKIRISYNDIELQVRVFDIALDRMLKRNKISKPRLTWDIHLVQVGKLRSNMLELQGIGGERRRELLLKALPRFIWRALARNDNNQPVFDMLFDATDIQQGNLLEDIIEYDYDKDYSKAARDLWKVIHQDYTGPARRILDWFKKHS